jgi:hypothetical protein
MTKEEKNAFSPTRYPIELCMSVGGDNGIYSMNE